MVVKHVPVLVQYSILSVHDDFLVCDLQLFATVLRFAIFLASTAFPFVHFENQCKQGMTTMIS